MKSLIVVLLITGCQIGLAGEYFCYSTADSAKEAGRGRYPVIQADGKFGQTLYEVAPVLLDSTDNGKPIWGVPATADIKEIMRDIQPIEAEPKKEAAE